MTTPTSLRIAASKAIRSGQFVKAAHLMELARQAEQR